MSYFPVCSHGCRDCSCAGLLRDLSSETAYGGVVGRGQGWKVFAVQPHVRLRWWLYCTGRTPVFSVR